MKWHLGLLDPDPSSHRSYQWMRRGSWLKPGFPPDVLHELAVWLAMPGFQASYHTHNLGVTRHYYLRAKAALPDFESLRSEVSENWLSITREDAVKLCQLRRGAYACVVPIVSQLRILDDMKAGMSQTEVAREYGITRRTVYTIYHRGVQWSGQLPQGFEWLVNYR